MTPFTDSLNTFEADNAEWLAGFTPELVTLRYLAFKLDHEEIANPAPLVAQFGLTLRNLRKMAPGSTETEDPLEAALKAAEGQA